MLHATSASLIVIALLCIFQCLEANKSGGSFQSIALETHNEYRHIHKVSPLKWDWKLADHAQGWADRCRFRHSKDRRPYNNNTGENISYGFSSIRTAVKDWYETEVNNYDFNRGRSRNGREILHFTQVVWRETTHVGCAETYCNNLGGHYYVCNYYPQGNYDGKFVQNVSPRRMGTGLLKHI